MKAKQISIFFIAILFFAFPNYSGAVGCEDLDSTEKIKKFLQKSQLSNPLLRKNASLTLILDACEGKACQSKSKRAAQKELLRVQRLEQNRRIFFAKGSQAPRCVIQRGNRRFVCSRCGIISNENCRSFPSDKSTIFPGTNIDSADFALLTGSGPYDVRAARCSPLKKNPRFLKIETLLSGPDVPASGEAGLTPETYDRVLSYYDKEKGVPIMVNFFANKVLRKIYRFFPKYYVRLGEQWVSTVLRVRTTQGNEKKYIFETLIHVRKKGKNYELYLNLADDPELKNVPLDSLFITD